ncbi:MAG TPA: endonuclease III, partial [Gammaproteobacteria bacterium]|nr:endonuclease III [Gammaproteobacteria bacterium]
VEGIAVDTHVRRLSKFFGLTDENDPQKIEQDLMRILPPSEWSGFTYRIIEYGRKFQTARTKNVDSLPLTAALKRAGL